MSRVLVVEPDRGLASFLMGGLDAEGFATTHAATGGDAVAAAAVADFDLMILDLDVPDAAAGDLLAALRTSRPSTPILAVSAELDPVEISGLLTAGVADHMTKPVQIDELVARTRLRLRQPADLLEKPIDCGALALDIQARRAYLDGDEVTLSAREFALVEALVRHRGQVLSREQLTSMVWGLGSEPASNAVDVHVRNLRKKIGADVIVTVRGLGYRVEVDETEPARN